MAQFTIRPAGQQDEIDNITKTAMSKATFEAIARDNRDKFAGSGFIEWGKHYTVNGSNCINEGLYTESLSALYMGRRLIDGKGISKTQDPLVNINGVITRLNGISSADTAVRSAIIQLPPAPTVYPFGTTNHLITEGLAIAHADASNSGLILNGKFDTDTVWTKSEGWVISGGVATATETSLNINQTIPIEAGKTYIIEFDATITSGAIKGELNGQVGTLSSSGRLTFEVTATTNSTTMPLYIYGGNFSGSIDNVAVFPKDAISRSDLVFLESWHEDTSEKGVLYDLGNVQYKGTRSVGSAGTFSGSDTYSLFGNWQEANALVGNSISIASLTQAQLQAFVGNPENNCYYDGAKLIQVRYRVRTIAGWGDSWYNVDTNFGKQYLRYSITANDSRVIARGKKTTFNDYENNTNLMYCSAEYSGVTVDKENGHFTIPTSTADRGVAYENKVFALPIALVHRRNQGAYHPVFNANGTRYSKLTISDASSKWYVSGANELSSIADTFTLRSFATNLVGAYSSSGYIASAISGRPDGLFYDQIAEGDITDLRSSAHDTNDMEVMNSIFNGAINGSERGSEGEWEMVDIEAVQDTNNSAGFQVKVNDSSNFKVGDRIRITSVDSLVVLYVTVTASVSNYITWVGQPLNRVIGHKYSIAKQSTRKKSNTITHCDIIGDPANYPQSWKDNGVIGTPLLVGENGEDYIPDGTSKTIKLSNKMSDANMLLGLYSDDNGATWGARTITGHINTTTNSAISQAYPIGRLEMIFYTTHTNMAEPTVNSAVRNGVIGDVISDQYKDSTIASSLIGKVSVGASIGVAKSRETRILENAVTVDGKITIYTTTSPFHSTISPHYTSPAVKTFPYLTTENGRKVVNLVFKEMKYDAGLDNVAEFTAVIVNTSYAYVANTLYKLNHVDFGGKNKKVFKAVSAYSQTADYIAGYLYDSKDGLIDGNGILKFEYWDGNGWGDDSKFNITNNVSTTIDDNANVVLIGQKKIVTPYFAKEK